MSDRDWFGSIDDTQQQNGEPVTEDVHQESAADGQQQDVIRPDSVSGTADTEAAAPESVSETADTHAAESDKVPQAEDFRLHNRKMHRWETGRWEGHSRIRAARQQMGRITGTPHIPAGTIRETHPPAGTQEMDTRETGTRMPGRDMGQETAGTGIPMPMDRPRPIPTDRTLITARITREIRAHREIRTAIPIHTGNLSRTGIRIPVETAAGR
ncbi:MAG: hypothetical protein ACLR0F_23315 [Eisenbergiella sp.]